MRPSFTFLSGIAIASAFFLGLGMQSMSSGPSASGGGDALALSRDVREFLSHLSMVDMDTGYGTVRAVQISGINVQVVNGSGTSDWQWSNGTGNLILGYNEYGYGLDRRGSHNLVVGVGNYWSTRGSCGIVAGLGNHLFGDHSCVLGGVGNESQGDYSVVVGGTANTSRGPRSVVGGGSMRSADGENDFAAGSLWEDF